MNDYKPNSHRFKEEQETAEKKKVEKVVTGKVKTKKNEVRKFADVFISEDAANVKSYILMDVLVPAIKKAVSDIVTDGINMLLFGESGRKRNTSSGSKVSYSSYYSGRDERRDEPRRSNRFDYDDFVFDTRVDAEAVLDQMDEVLDKYRFVTVADLYDMCDKTAPYTGNKYGWTNIRTAEVVRVRDGYVIKLPKATPLD